MWAIVIEQSDMDPRVVTFSNERAAQDWRDNYEKSTKGQWDSDPMWNHYPRDPIAVLGQAEAMELLAADILADIEEFGETP